MHVFEEVAPPRARGFVDRLGVVASLLCLIHCLATPLVVALLPVVAGERFEGALSAVLVALATFSTGASWRRGDRRPLVPYGLGLAALGLRAAAARPEADPLDTVLVLVAACALIVTHLLGLRAARGAGDRATCPRGHDREDTCSPPRSLAAGSPAAPGA